jgi:amino acid adenylation domain-containing protein
MVPGAYVMLEAFPLTANGKLDRKALPAPDAAAVTRREYEAPQGELETALAALWSELLGVERVGRHDHFFELGGHSLLAVQMLGRVQHAMGIEASLRNLFGQPQLAAFAAALPPAGSNAHAIPLAARDAPLPLSFAQQRLWFLDQLDRQASLAYHMPAALRLSGKLDRAALQAALDGVVARHESLRTSVGQEQGQPVQRFAPADCGFALAERDLGHLRGHEQELALEMAVTDEAAAPFDLAAGPLVRGTLLRLAEEEHVLLVTQHHIVTDGWSVGVLVREVGALYAAFSQGLADPLPPLAIQYADYAAWQRAWLQGEALAQQAAFWKETLAGAPAVLELPLDRPRPAAQSYEGASLRFTLPAALADGLRALGQRHGATLFMTLLAGWSALMARLSGQDDIVVGTPVANRRRAETEGLIGFFVNTLALRVRFDGAPDVARLLEQVKAATLAAFEHQDLPFEQVVEAVQPERSMRYNPLFQVMLSMNNTPAQDLLSLPGLAVEMLAQQGGSTQFDLNLALTEQGGAIAARLDYATALFDRATVERMAGHFQMLLGAMAGAASEAPVARLEILDAAQRMQLLSGFNATAASYDGPVLLHHMLEEQALRQAGAVALVLDQRQVSFGELNAHANRVAHQLLAMGVQPDDRVAICAERSIDMVAGLFGILKAGAGYVPLDPSYPADRLAYMLADCAPKAVLVQAALAARLACGAPKLLLEQAGEGQPDSNPQVALHGANLAYVIYTSGSTGQPKGVMNEHAPVANRLHWMQQQFALDGHDCVLQKTPFGFDVSVWEFFWPMLAGARLVLARPEGHKAPDYLRSLIDAAGVSTLHFVPSMLQVFVDAAGDWQGASLRQVFCSGEALPAQLRARFLKRFPQVALHNLYGPTEAAVDVTWFDCASAAWPQIVPIGRPIANTSMYVLDAHGEPVPVGVAGELHIGGVQVARGYLNRPELTAERFVRDPFSSAAGARLYKTGDLGRWLPDGNIEYLGRNDFQVKIRGFRIELGEIEARLVACAGVREAVVLAREDQPGDKRLVAYLLADGDIDQAALRAALQAELPEHMVPAAFVALPSFPLSPNGKLDRKALPAPDAAAVTRREYEAPQGELETALAALWSELLGVERVGRHDHFFELGGHSLLAVQMLGRVQHAMGIEASLRNLFGQPQLAAFAAALPPAGSNAHAIPLAARDAPLPLSFAQQRLWFLDQLDRQASLAYHMPAALRLSGKLDRAALQAALDGVVARHESLRTSVGQEQGQPVQRFAPADCGFALAERDLGHLRGHEQELALEMAVTDEAAAPFDLAAGPLVRGTLLRLAEEEHVLLVTQHHIVTDGWSVGVLVREVGALYAAFSQGLADPLPPLAIQYADYAAWQRAWLQGEALAQQAAFWKETLAGAPAVLELPLDRPRPAAQSYEGASLRFTLPAALADGLRALGQRHGATLFMTLLAGWSALMARLSGQDDIVVGTPVANRRRAETEGLIGFFVNTLALRVRFDGAPDVARLLEQVKAATLAAFEHQDLPFEQVVEAVQPERSMRYNPLFQVMLSMNNTPAQDLLSLPGLAVEMLAQQGGSTQFDLNLALTEQGGAIAARLDYATALFDRATVERMAGHFQMLLGAMAGAASEAPVARLEILDAAQRMQLLSGFNATAASYDGPVLLHHMLEEQALRQAGAVALVLDQRQVSFGELNAHANRVAHQLLAMGVQPDDRVAICAERSIDMVAGLFGILKAGAGYVPLDPSYPADRLAYMLADCAPKAVLVQAALAARLACGAPKLLLEQAGEGQPDSNPQVALHGANLAYVIYTSGSTGQPKGVMNEHAPVANRLHWMQQQFALDGHDCVLQKTPFGFDVSVWEFFWPMLAGARLVLARPEGHKAPDYLRSLIDAAGVSTLHFVPSMLQVFVDAAGDWQGASLRQVFCSGEALPAQLRARFLKRFPQVALHNLYGPTEAAVDVTWFDCASAAWPQIVPIGRPIANTSMYVLDAHGEPVPVGVAGELHIGGVQVARGYLNRPELTAERFVRDPFSSAAGARLYKTGDLGRWLPDGNIEYLGRNDFQVKIRGFRIELGEIEARLVACAGVREAVVLAREDQPGDKRLVAYLLADGDIDQAALRAALQAELPEHMVPAAFVAMPSFPLSPNGKLDRKALPAPDATALARREYEAPQGELEGAIAALWSELLGVTPIGRHDHFFELGGHSLLVIRVIDGLKNLGWQADVRSVFSNPTVAMLAAAAARHEGAGAAAVVPPALIPPGCAAIAPAMLPMVSLSQEQIDAIAAQALGGAANVQDIYPLAPLQKGLLFHSLLDAQGDTYLLRTIAEFADAAASQAFMAALQAVVARHDILRTLLVWQGVAAPVQVVLRHAEVPLHLVTPAGGESALAAVARCSDPRHVRLDLGRAPLVAAYCAHETDGRVVLALLSHHLVGDHVTMEAIIGEVVAILDGRGQQLPQPVQYRDFIAGLGAAGQPDHRSYFDSLLGDVSEPCLPFGLRAGEPAVAADVSSLALPDELSTRIVAAARAAGVTTAALFHTAWARVVAATSGRGDAIFGTVLLGRMHAGGSGNALGMFINTLPVRMDVMGSSVVGAARQAFGQLTALLEHEQASLAEAQRCAGLPAGEPLFSSLLNYRHSTPSGQRERALAGHGMRLCASEEHLSYPVGVNVDDFGGNFAITAHCRGVAAPRIAQMLAQAMDGVCAALLLHPDSALSDVSCLPPAEMAQLALAFNATGRPYPEGRTVHEVFSDVARRYADSVALVEGDMETSYAELERRANRIAHKLRALGVGNGDRVAIHAQRNSAMVAGLLGILKAGAAYLPIDAGYPAERIAHMLADAAPAAMLAQHGAAAGDLPTIVLDETCLAEGPCSEPAPAATASSLAYVMYTSGSTGIPNGVAVEHRNVLRLAVNGGFAPLTPDDCVAHCASPSFDASTWELWAPLLCGARVVLVAQDDLLRPARLNAVLERGGVNAMWLTAGLFNEYVDALEPAFARLKYLLVGGDQLDPRTIRRAQSKPVPPRHIINGYGPTETTTFACTYDIPLLAQDALSVPVGRPIGNTQVYVLDAGRRLVPAGATGEIHIGGVGVARGYLGRDALTAERFVSDPFSNEPGARLYRTGDMGRINADGLLECLGRMDTQVKIRGFRIETGEIEARLAACDGVREAVVLAREGAAGGKRLVAYVLRAGQSDVSPRQLRDAVAAALPAYMVPSAFVVMDAFPLTGNGKLDRRALPEPDAAALAAQQFEAPQGEVEVALAQIWSEMLGIDQVGRHDNFFELGGHSLMAVQLLEKGRQAFQVEPALKDLFEHPVLSQLAARIAALQYQQFLGATQGELEQELDLLSESELLAILAAESGKDE